MNDYHVSEPIVLSWTECKVLVNHVLIDVSLTIAGRMEFRNIGYFPLSEQDEVRQAIIEKIRQCAKTNTIKARNYINFYKKFLK
jgi:hypothetical protein